MQAPWLWCAVRLRRRLPSGESSFNCGKGAIQRVIIGHINIDHEIATNACGKWRRLPAKKAKEAAPDEIMTIVVRARRGRGRAVRQHGRKARSRSSPMAIHRARRLLRGTLCSREERTRHAWMPERGSPRRSDD